MSYNISRYVICIIFKFATKTNEMKAMNIIPKQLNIELADFDSDRHRILFIAVINETILMKGPVAAVFDNILQ